MSDAQLYKRLNDDLEVVRREIVELLVGQDKFCQLQRIIAANPDINEANEFYDWIEGMYAASMAAAIRRQVDRRPDSISFANFLNEVKKHPDVVTRESYKTLFASSSSEDIDADFDTLVGVGKEYLSSSAVQHDLEMLSRTAGALRDYANNWIAHRAKNPSAIGSTWFGDIDEAINVSEALLIKYLHLFRSEVVGGLLPISQHNWKAIFRVPWIQIGRSSV